MNFPLQIAPAANSQFPRGWLVKMAAHWMDDSEKGFYTDVPLAAKARQVSQLEFPVLKQIF